MSDLKQVHEDLNIVWQFYKRFSQIEPKDDYFFSQMAAEAKKIQTKTRFGKKILIDAIAAISEEDYERKQEQYKQMEIQGGKQ